MTRSILVKHVSIILFIGWVGAAGSIRNWWSKLVAATFPFTTRYTALAT